MAIRSFWFCLKALPSEKDWLRYFQLTKISLPPGLKCLSSLQGGGSDKISVGDQCYRWRWGAVRSRLEGLSADMITVLYTILKTVLQLVTEIPPFTINYVWVGPASTKSFPSVCSPRVPKDKGQKADRNPSEFTPCCPPQVFTKISVVRLEKVVPILELIARKFLCSPSDTASSGLWWVCGSSAKDTELHA